MKMFSYDYYICIDTFKCCGAIDFPSVQVALEALWLPGTFCLNQNAYHPLWTDKP